MLDITGVFIKYYDKYIILITSKQTKSFIANVQQLTTCDVSINSLAIIVSWQIHYPNYKGRSDIINNTFIHTYQGL